MPVFEFICPQGHTTESLTSPDVKQQPCMTCMAERAAGRLKEHTDITAKRVLSATRTTFQFADRKQKL